MDIDTYLIPFKYGKRDKSVFEYYKDFLSGMTGIVWTRNHGICYCKS